MSTEIRRQYHEELDDVRTSIARLGAMVIECIPMGTEALLSDDLGDAKAVIDGDDPIDALSIEIEEHCYRLLALQQPMARDLRAIMTAVRLISEMERSADLMVNVAKASRRLYGVEFDPRLRGLVSRMAEEAQRLFELAVDSYVDGDVDKAAALDDMDDALDSLHKQFIKAIFESHQASKLALEAGVQLALIGRYYERIGDHAVNIGERVLYMVTGWLPEHTGAARDAARLAAEASPFSSGPDTDDRDGEAGDHREDHAGAAAGAGAGPPVDRPGAAASNEGP